MMEVGGGGRGTNTDVEKLGMDPLPAAQNSEVIMRF